MASIVDNVVSRFIKLSKIPRPSHIVDGVQNFIKEWAKSKKLVYRQDICGNVVVVVGNESSKNLPIILQTHMDMAATKDLTSDHNFDTDPIEVIVDNNIMYANKTTLGADNGVSLVTSMILIEEILENKSFLQNNTIYLLFTCKEEVGCIGAEQIDPYPFLPNNAYILNLDSEVNGEVCAGSAGGSEAHITIPITQTKYDIYGTTYIFKLSSFKSGHSGLQINDGNANAIKVLANILHEIDVSDLIETHEGAFLIHRIDGGNAGNSIAGEASAEFSTTLRENRVLEIIESYISSVKARYNETSMTISIEKIIPEKIYDFIATQKTLNVLLLLHQGIIDMTHHNKKNVETSTNIGIVKTTDDSIDITCLTRSFTEQAMREYHTKLEVITNLVDVSCSEFTCYSSWSPSLHNNYVLKKLKKAHKELFGKECNVTVVHAGLELGILFKKYPGWTGMSIGPTIKDAHTSKEYCELDTIEHFYKWLKHTVLDHLR